VVIVPESWTTELPAANNGTITLATDTYTVSAGVSAKNFGSEAVTIDTNGKTFLAVSLLNVAGGSASGITNNADTTFKGSGCVIAVAGLSGTYSSRGIFVSSGNLYVQDTVDVTAIGGVSSPTTGGSYGICTNNKLIVSGGTVNAVGGYSDADSAGIRVALQVTDGTVNAVGGNSKTNSSGAEAPSQSLEVTGGTVNAVGGAADGSSCGISAYRATVSNTGVVDALGRTYGLKVDYSGSLAGGSFTGGTAAVYRSSGVNSLLGDGYGYFAGDTQLISGDSDTTVGAAYQTVTVKEAAPSETHSHPICGASHTDIGDHTGECGAVEWTAWDGTNGITYANDAAYVYLSQDTERSSTLQIDGTKTLNLCLNGHTLTYTGSEAGSVIKLLESGRLNICDCSQGVLHYGQWNTDKTTYTISDGVPEGEYDVLSGGIITGGSACGVSVGSATKTNPPAINMYGGNIAGNYNSTSANTDGGGGLNLLSTKMNLYGGGIIGNGRATSYYCHGGGIGISGSSTLTMYGGKVENNVTTATGDNSYGGGGIYIAPGSSFYMYDGSISCNYSAGNGGGIAVWGHNYSDGSSHVELQGGEISNNVAAGNGGGISLKGKTNNYKLTVSMSGGTISDNTATEFGGGVFGMQFSKFEVSDDVVITGNKINGADNNLWLDSGKTITVNEALASGANVGVTMYEVGIFAQPDGTNVTSLADGYADKFTSDNTAYAVVVDGDNLKLAEAVTVSFNANGGSGTMADVEVEKDGTYTLPSCDFTAPTGKQFKGWAQAADGEVISGTALTVSANTTLYAVWEDRPADTTAPTLSAGTAVRTGADTATVKFTSNEAGTYYYEVVDSGAEAPDIDTSGTGASCDSTEQTISLTGLGEGAKDIYIVVKDGAGNVSEKIKISIPAYVSSDYSISADTDTIDFGSILIGGAVPEAQTVTITNDGNQQITLEQPSATDYTIGTLSASDLAPGETSTFTVQPNSGLAVGIYDEAITVRGVDGNLNEISVSVSFSVIPAAPTGLSGVAPTSSANNDGKITGTTSLMEYSATADFASATICGEGETTGLSSGTYYVRLKATQTEPAGAAATVSVPAYQAPSTPSTPSGPSTPSTVNITVPVSGEENTVHVNAKVTGESASVEPVDESEVEHISEGETDMPVTMDFSVLNRNITEVVIPTQSIELISVAASDPDTAVTGLRVDLPAASIEFDAPALSVIAEAAKDEDDVTIIIDERAASTLTSAQRNAIKDMPNALVIEATVLVNGQPVHSFFGGKATVTFPYKLTSGQSGEYVTVWHIADDGTKEAMRTKYDTAENMVMFIAPHLSHYVVTADEANYTHVCPSEPYVDVNQALWYHEPIDFVIDNGLMVGTAKNTFEPNTGTSRAMIVTILWRLEGSPQFGQGKSGTFADVPEYAYYTEAVEWGAANGIIAGYGNGNFGPQDAITREQLAAILWRYAKYKGYDVSVGENTNILSYDDALTISEYAIPAMQWACGAGIFEGYPGENGTMLLGPKGPGTRAQSAAVIQRFCELDENNET